MPLTGRVPLGFGNGDKGCGPPFCSDAHHAHRRGLGSGGAAAPQSQTPGWRTHRADGGEEGQDGGGE